MRTFPALRSDLSVTPQAFAAQAGFQMKPCPLCGSHEAATCLVDGDDAAWWVCETCQRFSLTGVAASTLRRLHDQRHPRCGRIKTGLGRYCSASVKPVDINDDNLHEIAA